MSYFIFMRNIDEGKAIPVYGDGSQFRDFTYVDDIARGTIAALKPLGYEVINLGGHEVITINGLVELIEELAGKKANVQHGAPNLADMFMNQANVTKAREVLGWDPQVNLREGIKRLIDWYLAERSWAKEVLTP